MHLNFEKIVSFTSADTQLKLTAYTERKTYNGLFRQDLLQSHDPTTVCACFILLPFDDTVFSIYHFLFYSFKDFFISLSNFESRFLNVK